MNVRKILHTIVSTNTFFGVAKSSLQLDLCSIRPNVYVYLKEHLKFVLNLNKVRKHIPITLYPTPILLLVLMSASSLWAQDYIKRATVSAAPQTVETQHHLVQQSLGFTALMPTQQHATHTVSRGFLLPQTTAIATAAVPQHLTWSLYPNPFTTHINIDFDGPVSGALELQLYTISGQLLWHKSLSAQQQQRIPISGLPQGAYLIRFDLNGKTYSTQLLKDLTQH